MGPTNQQLMKQMKKDFMDFCDDFFGAIEQDLIQTNVLNREDFLECVKRIQNDYAMMGAALQQMERALSTTTQDLELITNQLVMPTPKTQVKYAKPTIVKDNPDD